MRVYELIDILKSMPQTQEVCFYIKDLERKGDRSVYNWRDITRIAAVYGEHDDYVVVDLGRLS